MKEDSNSEDYRLQLEKARKNLTYAGMFSVIMLFAGLTSAYIVSMGDTYWLKASLPDAFFISTGILVLSSIVIQMAVVASKKNNMKRMKWSLIMTLVLGISFIYFQFKGYDQLVQSGVHFTGSGIVVSEGRYGDYYEVKVNNDFIEVDGNDLFVAGKPMTQKQIEEYKKFMIQFIDPEEKNKKIENYGKFILYLHSEKLALVNGKLQTPDGVELKFLDEHRLSQLAYHVRDGRGHFYARGKIGEDFHIYFKRQELSYKDGNLMRGSQKLDTYLQNKLNEAADTASSYLYLITFVHLLHIVFTIFFLIKLVIHSFTGRINGENNISVRTGAIFWHFLGLLWLYLLLFLLFIH